MRTIVVITLATKTIRKRINLDVNLDMFFYETLELFNESLCNVTHCSSGTNCMHELLHHSIIIAPIVSCVLVFVIASALHSTCMHNLLEVV